MYMHVIIYGLLVSVSTLPAGDEGACFFLELGLRFRLGSFTVSVVALFVDLLWALLCNDREVSALLFLTVHV